MARKSNQRKRPRRQPDARPDPPWGNFPLAEILVLAGIVFGLWGFAAENAVMIVVGLALASIGGLEVSVREHFGGYRSHTVLLSALPAFAVLLVTYYLFGGSILISAILAAITLIAAFFGLREAFRRASGGYTVRIGKFRG